MTSSPRLRLYGVSSSRASRCQWALGELAVDYELIPVDDHSGETRSQAFLAINPNGKVPCLLDGELRIFESLAINLYLARKFDRGLWPGSLEAEGLAYQWSFWVLNEIENLLMEYLHARARRDDRAMHAVMSALEHPMRVLETELDDGDFLLENRFTIADLNAAANFSAAAFFDYDFSAWPVARAWLQRCYARPAADVAGSSLQRFRLILGV